jgi:hypothetical protein
MMFLTRPMKLAPPQWPCWDERKQLLTRERGWAMTERHLPPSLVAAAMDQSKLLKDNRV